MAFLLIGVLVLAAKLIGLVPVAEWSWWIVLSPFVLAAAWWAWSDKTGHTRRKAMRDEQLRKEERRRSVATGMGMLKFFDRKVAAKLRSAEERENAARQKQVSKIVKERERQRQIIRDSVLTSRMDSRFEARGDAEIERDSPAPRT